MRKILVLLLMLFFTYTNLNFVWATTIKIISKEKAERQNKEIVIKDFFNYFWGLLDNKIPKSYKYIQLNIKWVNKNSNLYNSLQKLVYLNLINNKSTYLNQNKKVNAYIFYRFAEKFYNTKLIDFKDINWLKSRKATFLDFQNLENLLKKTDYKLDFYKENNSLLNKKKAIFLDVYRTLSTRHYKRDDLSKEKMIEQATVWLAKWTEDKFTVYFPPTENKQFNETLAWEYEWIWAYVDMEEPGILKIVAPISGSPAEKAWLKWWDIIVKVDWKEVKTNNSLQEVISWIKGKAWTSVLLTIKRWNKLLDIEVKRAKIVIKEVEYKLLNRYTYYIKLKFFGPNISKEFKEALKDLKKHRNIRKVIIDLRNNPGWYLDQVTDMLSYFVPSWEITAVVKYYDGSRIYKSRWYDLVDFSNYKIVILQNSGSASASEILIGWIIDYYPKAQLIWEKTYWKWSVQTIKEYSDWSSLKYTIAKWFTWKTQTWIDWVWIYPTIKMEDKLGKTWIDPILQKAIRLK